MATVVTRSKNKRKAPVLKNGTYKKRKLLDNKSENIQNENSGNEADFETKMLKFLDEELRCNICTEFFIKPLILNCSHTFCEYCILKWMKQQQRCPICRAKISSHTRVWAFDGYIEKALDLLSSEQKKDRQKIINHRELKSQPKPRRSQRLKNKICTGHDALDESGLHLRALVDEVLQLAPHLTSD